MIISQFNKLTLSSLVLAPGLLLFCWAPSLQKGSLVNTDHAMPLFELLVSGTNSFPRVNNILAILMIAAGGVLLNYFLNRNEILSERSVLPGTIYFLLMSCSVSMIQLHALILSNVFILLALIRLSGSYRADEAFGVMFDAGFMISIGSLFYFPSLVIFPVVWVALIVIRPFIWREWVISLLGLLIPYLFAFGWYYYYDSINLLIFDKIFFPSPGNPFDLQAQRGTFIGLSAYLAVFFVLALLRVLAGWPVNTIQSRNMLVVLWWVLGLSVLAYLMAPEFDIVFLSGAAIPVSVFMANYLIEMRREWLSDLFFIGLIIVIGLEIY